MECFDKFVKRVNVIVITPHGKAGSLFVQGILDGHPELLSLPYFINNYNIDYDNLDNVGRINKFLLLNKDICEAGENLNINFDEIALFDKKSIKIEMLNALDSLHEEPDRKSILLSIYYAFSKILNHDTSKSKYIVTHIHLYDSGDEIKRFTNSVEHHISIFQDFEKSIYIPLLSSPLLSLSSYLNHECQFHYLIYHAVYLKSCYESLSKLTQLSYSDSFYEFDINVLNETLGAGLRDALKINEINYNPSMDRCTFLGVDWKGVSQTNNDLSTYDASVFNKKKEILQSINPFSKHMQYISFGNSVLQSNRLIAEKETVYVQCDYSLVRLVTFVVFDLIKASINTIKIHKYRIDRIYNEFRYYTIYFSRSMIYLFNH